MSTTGTTGVPAAIADYAAAVRRELGDLPKHDVDELTEGLDADLLEQFRESGTAPSESPAAYAAELRTSAGLAPATVSGTAGGGFRSWWRTTTTRLVQTLEMSPMVRPVSRFLAQLRPVWWVLRAWIVYRVFMMLWGSGESYYFLPRNALTWALLIVLVVLSVRFSLKTLPSGRWPARLRSTLNAVTALIALAVIPTAIMVINRSPEHDGYGPTTGGPCALYDGVCHNGSVVGPFFVYGPDGTRLENVRFFTNDGSSIPIDLAPADDPGPWVVAPRSTSGASAPGMSPVPSATTPAGAGPGAGATSAPHSPAPSSSATPAPTTPAPKPSATPGR